MIFEKITNLFKIILHKITGCSYITHKEGYPTYHRSKAQIRKDNERAKAAAERAQQVLGFRLEDMYQYDTLPFDWNRDLFYSKDKAFLPLVGKNKEMCLWYISEIANLIEDTKSFVVGISHPKIKTADIDFEYPIPFYMGCAPNTYLECLPYTKTGKRSKYPVILHFSASEEGGTKNNPWQFHPYIGEIKILCDGSIGAANVTFAKGHYKYAIRLYGTSLVVKRIDCECGNIYLFGDID